MINCIICFYSQLEASFQTKFHPLISPLDKFHVQTEFFSSRDYISSRLPVNTFLVFVKKWDAFLKKCKTRK